MEGLSVNFTFTNLVEVLEIHEAENVDGAERESRNVTCQSGMDNHQAVAKCLDCQHYLCESCMNMHKKLNVFVNHRTVSLSDIKEDVRTLEQKRYCSEHEGEELKLYCRTCQEVICRDCTIVTHKQHDYTFVKYVKEELSKELEVLTNEVEARSVEFKRHADLLEKSMSSISDNATAMEEHIRVCFEERISKLQLQCSALVGKVLEQKATKLEKLSAQKMAAEHTLSNMTNAISFTKQTLSSASTTDLAMMSKQTSNQLQLLACQHVDSSAGAQAITWGFHEEQDLLTCQVHRAAPVAVITSVEGLSLGKNLIVIKLNGDTDCSAPRLKVDVILPLEKTCKDMDIVRVNRKSWHVNFFIPLPGQVRLSVSVCSVPADGSPFLLNCSSNLTPGMLVRRGPHWDWGDQDGGPGNVGTFTGYQPYSYNCSVLVLWPGSNRTNSYRWGAGGIYDVELAPQE